MLRALVFCMPLLLAAGAVVAGDAPASDTSSHTVAANTASHSVAASNERAATKKAEQKPAAKKQKDGSQPDGDVEMSGMSILGNDEAPKSLVIVPWKSSQLGGTPGISKLLDDSAQPVDKEVFLRELAYYQIRSGSK
jgi:hypothetical protein